MATITLTVVAGQTFTEPKTVSGTHLTRLLAAEKSLRNMPDATDAQILHEVAESLWAQLRARVRQVEEGAALTSAAAGVVEIAFT